MKANRCRRAIAMVLFLLLACTTCMTPVALASGVDVQRQATLSVYFGKDGAGFADVPFAIYRVADVSESGHYTLTGDFADYPVTLQGLDSAGWRALAQTLDAYVARDGLQPLQAGKTGANGQVAFSTLQAGLYLVRGESTRQGEERHTPEPLLVSLPAQAQAGARDYDVSVSCKFDSVPDTGATVTRKVIKVWKNDGEGAARPEEISVQLLENGAVVETVTLGEHNHWEYTWQGLNGHSTWQVVEEQTPTGYSVCVVREGTTFVLTNTYASGTLLTPTPVPSNIPQTGMLWWPVPLLACAGLLLLVVGCIVRRGHGERDGQ